MRHTLATVASIIAILSPGVVRADDDGPSERWYGWQLLIVDGLVLGAAGLGFALAEDSSEAILGTAAVGYALGGPTVHWAHGHTMKGVGSLGLRLGIPLASGVVFGALFSGSANHAMSGFEAGFLFIGLPVGAVTAILIDAIVLGWEPAPIASTRIVPSLSPGQLGLALQGRF